MPSTPTEGAVSGATPGGESAVRSGGSGPCASSSSHGSRDTQQQRGGQWPREPLIGRAQPLLSTLCWLELVDLVVDRLQRGRISGAEIFAASGFGDGLEAVLVKVGIAGTHAEEPTAGSRSDANGVDAQS